MSSAALTFPPTATARLVVDTDVASFIFKWHPEFAPRYVGIIRGYELIISFMTLAEMRQGAVDASWGPRKLDVLDAYLADFAELHSDSLLCSTWAGVRNESKRKGCQMSSADAWIAATALVLSVPLVTNNPKDYHHLAKLQIVSAVWATGFNPPRPSNTS
jgi:predicted nucleic acid-binding protein